METKFMNLKLLTCKIWILIYFMIYFIFLHLLAQYFKMIITHNRMKPLTSSAITTRLFLCLSLAPKKLS